MDAMIIDAKSNGNGRKANAKNITTTEKPSTPKGTLLHFSFKRWQIEYEY